MFINTATVRSIFLNSSIMEAFKNKNKKIWNFPNFSKPTQPTHLVWKKNKNNMVSKSFLSKNKPFGKKLFFPIEKVQNT